MADIGLSAFSLFFMRSESFLAYQRSLEEGRKTSNCHTLFGMRNIPTDNHIRSTLEPVHPSHLQSCFDQLVAAMREQGGMKAFERLDGRTLIAFDGTEYFCSQKLGCPHCQTRKRSNGKTELSQTDDLELLEMVVRGRTAASDGGARPFRTTGRSAATIAFADASPEPSVGALASARELA